MIFIQRSFIHGRLFPHSAYRYHRTFFLSYICNCLNNEMSKLYRPLSMATICHESIVKKYKTNTISRGSINFNETMLYCRRNCEYKNNILKEKDRIWTIPNLLCISRIISSPFTSYFIIYSNFNVAIVIIALAGITDFADGLIARKFANQDSKLGSFLDPLADKIFIITLYASLTYTNLIPGILTSLIVFRDIVLLAAGTYIRYVSLPHPKNIRQYFDASYSEAKLFPTYMSKVNTLVQFFTAIISLYGPNSALINDTFLYYLWWTAGCTTILSSISYLIKKKTYMIPKRTVKSNFSNKQNTGI